MACDNLFYLIKMKGIGSLPVCRERDGIRVFDPNVLIQMPDSYYLSLYGDDNDAGLAWYMTRHGINPLDDDMVNTLDSLCFHKPGVCPSMSDKRLKWRSALGLAKRSVLSGRLTDSTLYATGKRMYHNFQVYGARNFSDWRKINWGFDYMLIDSDIQPDHVIIHVHDLISPNIFAELSRQYPDQKIITAWEGYTPYDGTSIQTWLHGKPACTSYKIWTPPKHHGDQFTALI